MAEKQFIDLPPDTNIDGTEVIPVQEAAGGAGSTKEITTDQMAGYANGQLTAERIAEIMASVPMQEAADTAGIIPVLAGGTTLSKSKLVATIPWILSQVLYPGVEPYWCQEAVALAGGNQIPLRSDEGPELRRTTLSSLLTWLQAQPGWPGGDLTPEAFAAFVDSLPLITIEEINEGLSLSGIYKSGTNESREVFIGTLLTWLQAQPGWPGGAPTTEQIHDIIANGTEFSGNLDDARHKLAITDRQAGDTQNISPVALRNWMATTFIESRTVRVELGFPEWSLTPGKTFNTIQAAVDYVSPLATGSEPWVIELAPGNYTESIVTPGVNNMQYVTIKGPTAAYSPNNTPALPVTWTITTGTWTALDRCQFQFIQFSFSGDAIINTGNLIFFSDCCVAVTDTAKTEGIGGVVFNRCHVNWASIEPMRQGHAFYGCTGWFSNAVFDTDGNANLNVNGGSMTGNIGWAGIPDWSPTNPRIYLNGSLALDLAAELLPHTRWAKFMVDAPTLGHHAANKEYVDTVPPVAHAGTHAGAPTTQNIWENTNPWIDASEAISADEGKGYTFVAPVPFILQGTIRLELGHQGTPGTARLGVCTGTPGIDLVEIETQDAAVIEAGGGLVDFVFTGGAVIPAGPVTLFLRGLDNPLYIKETSTTQSTPPITAYRYNVPIMTWTPGPIGDYPPSSAFFEALVGGASDPINGDAVAVAYNPVNYTAPTADVAGQLEGIDDALGTLSDGSYIPDDETKWTDPDPATFKVAIDRLAAAVVALQLGAPIA